MFGRNGLINNWLGLNIQIYGFWGLLLANCMYGLPQAVMIIEASLRRSDARLYEASLLMGASRWRQFCDVTLPATKFGLISAAFVIFTVSITDFGNAAVIGGNFQVLAMEIYIQVVGQMDFNMGAVVGITLLPTLLAVYNPAHRQPETIRHPLRKRDPGASPPGGGARHPVGRGGLAGRRRHRADRRHRDLRQLCQAVAL